MDGDYQDKEICTILSSSPQYVVKPQPRPSGGPLLKSQQQVNGSPPPAPGPNGTTAAWEPSALPQAQQQRPPLYNSDQRPQQDPGGLPALPHSPPLAPVNDLMAMDAHGSSAFTVPSMRLHTVNPSAGGGIGSGGSSAFREDNNVPNAIHPVLEDGATGLESHLRSLELGSFRMLGKDDIAHGGRGGGGRGDGPVHMGKRTPGPGLSQGYRRSRQEAPPPHESGNYGKLTLGPVIATERGARTSSGGGDGGGSGSGGGYTNGGDVYSSGHGMNDSGPHRRPPDAAAGSSGGPSHTGANGSSGVDEAGGWDRQFIGYSEDEGALQQQRQQQHQQRQVQQTQGAVRQQHYGAVTQGGGSSSGGGSNVRWQSQQRSPTRSHPALRHTASAPQMPIPGRDQPQFEAYSVQPDYMQQRGPPAVSQQQQEQQQQQQQQPLPQQLVGGNVAYGAGPGTYHAPNDGMGNYPRGPTRAMSFQGPNGGLGGPQAQQRGQQYDSHLGGSYAAPESARSDVFGHYSEAGGSGGGTAAGAATVPANGFNDGYEDYVDGYAAEVHEPDVGPSASGLSASRGSTPRASASRSSAGAGGSSSSIRGEYSPPHPRHLTHDQGASAAVFAEYSSPDQRSRNVSAAAMASEDYRSGVSGSGGQMLRRGSAPTMAHRGASYGGSNASGGYQSYEAYEAVVPGVSSPRQLPQQEQQQQQQQHEQLRQPQMQAQSPHLQAQQQQQQQRQRGMSKAHSMPYHAFQAAMAETSSSIGDPGSPRDSPRTVAQQASNAGLRRIGSSGPGIVGYSSQSGGPYGGSRRGGAYGGGGGAYTSGRGSGGAYSADIDQLVATLGPGHVAVAGGVAMAARPGHANVQRGPRPLAVPLQQQQQQQQQQQSNTSSASAVHGRQQAQGPSPRAGDDAEARAARQQLQRQQQQLQQQQLVIQQQQIVIQQQQHLQMQLQQQQQQLQMHNSNVSSPRSGPRMPSSPPQQPLLPPDATKRALGLNDAESSPIVHANLVAAPRYAALQRGMMPGGGGGGSAVSAQQQQQQQQLCEDAQRRTELVESPATRLAFKDFYRTFRAKEKSSFDAAKKFALDCFAMLPRKVHWRLYLEMADLAKRENRFGEARRLYRTVTKLQPYASQGWLEYAKLEEECGALRRCSQILRRGLSYCEHSESLLIKAVKHEERMDFLVGSRELLSRLKTVGIEKVWRTVLEGGLLEARIGRVEVARQVFAYLMTHVPWYGPIYFEAFRLEEKAEHFASALAIAERGLREIPRYGPLWFGVFRLCEKLDMREAKRSESFRRGNLPYLPRTADALLRARESISKELVWKVHFEAAQIEERVAGLCAKCARIAAAESTPAEEQSALIAALGEEVGDEWEQRSRGGSSSEGIGVEVVTNGSGFEDAAPLAESEEAAAATTVASATAQGSRSRVPPIDGAKQSSESQLLCGCVTTFSGGSAYQKLTTSQLAALPATEARDLMLGPCRACYAMAALSCPLNLRWKVWLAGARTELTAGRLDTARLLLGRAFDEVPDKSRSHVFLECSRLEEYSGDLAAARRILDRARRETRGEWKVYLESVLLEIRASDWRRAAEEALAALEVHSGAGRLWAVLVQLRQRQSDRAQLTALRRALREVPKSGEVWCEGARLHLNPLGRMFDVVASRRHLDFAIQFTPQYGDSFMEYLRLELLCLLLLPTAKELVEAQEEQAAAAAAMAAAVAGNGSNAVSLSDVARKESSSSANDSATGDGPVSSPPCGSSSVVSSSADAGSGTPGSSTSTASASAAAAKQPTSPGGAKPRWGRVIPEGVLELADQAAVDGVRTASAAAAALAAAIRRSDAGPRFRFTEAELVWLTGGSGGGRGRTVGEADILRASVEALQLRCVNADPNYGSMWFHCRQRPADTARSVLMMAKLMMAREMSELQQVYLAAMVRRMRLELDVDGYLAAHPQPPQPNELPSQQQGGDRDAKVTPATLDAAAATAPVAEGSTAAVRAGPGELKEAGKPAAEPSADAERARSGSSGRATASAEAAPPESDVAVSASAALRRHRLISAAERAAPLVAVGPEKVPGGAPGERLGGLRKEEVVNEDFGTGLVSLNRITAQMSALDEEHRRLILFGSDQIVP